jgi:hypothetical protein
MKIYYCKAEMRNFMAQKSGSCCFVYAAANCLIYLKKRLPNLEKAKDIACCRNGGTIGESKVIEYFKAPLEKTRNPKKVYKNGGILSILHPIFNGHALFLYPEENGLTLVNSWLGPNVIKGIGISKIDKFVWKNHDHYFLNI